MATSVMASDAATSLTKKVEFLVLGSGTSAGVPIIGCACDVCRSSDERDRRTRPSSCIRLVDASGDSRLILIDTSPDLREQSLRHGLDRCDAILFTHDHFDHTFGLDDVRRFNAVMRASIPVFAESATLESLHRIYEHIFHKERSVNASFVASLIPETIEAEKHLELFGLRITPLRVFHGNLPILGFRIDALATDGMVLEVPFGPLPLAYLTDVSRIPDGTWPHLEGLETLLLDMLRYTEHPTHFSVDQAVEAAHRIGARTTRFIHMTHDISHASLDSKLPAGMALAYDGLLLD